MSKDESLHSFIAAVNELYKPVQGRDTGFDVDFQSLKRLSANLKQSKDHESLQGQKLENKKKNRYKDILPFDYTRVKLNVVDEDPNSDYINASFIKGAEGHKNYIASQGPLPHTVNDFWQMLWQYNVTVVVMVCREFEMGKKKCERYWSEKGESKEFGNITVTLSDKEDLKDGYCLRTIKVQRGSESRNIQQFHYTSWPDHGVPKTCYEILTLINHVRDIQSYAKDEMTPLCVHCSAGCGRTGAVLAVDYVRNLLVEDKVSVGLRTYDIIAEMRKQRPAIVQTRDQYEFVNAAILEMFQIYMQTRTVSYKGFSTGYEQGDYVNINLSTASHNGTVEPKTTNSTRPTNLSYENIDMVRKHQNIKTLPSPKAGIGKANSIDDSPGPPPAKPSRTAGNNVRPVSMMIPPAAAHQNNLPGNPSTLKWDMVGGRKQSAPAIGCTPLQPKTNANNIVRSPLMPLGPLVGKEVLKPVPPKPLAKPKVNSPQPPAKPKLTKVDSGSKPVLGGRLSGNGHVSNVQVHAKISAAETSVKKPTLSLSLASPSKSPASPKSASSPKIFFARVKTPDKPPNSPLRNRFELPEANMVKKRIEALSPTEPKQVLETIENKQASDDKKSNESPKASEAPAIARPPVIRPKPRAIHGKFKAPVLTKVTARQQRPMAAPRPLSQNFMFTGGPSNNPMKYVSTVDVRKDDTAPAITQKRPSIVRSASLGGRDAPDQGESFRTVRSKFQNELPVSENANKLPTKVEVKVIPVNTAYTQAAVSYGAVYFTTKGPARSNSLRSPPQSGRKVNYSIAAPVPFKSPSARLSLPRKEPMIANSVIDNKKPHYASTSSLLSSPVSGNHDVEERHQYVNTEFQNKNKVHSGDTLPTTARQAENDSTTLSAEDSITHSLSPAPRRRRVRDHSPNTGPPAAVAYQNIHVATSPDSDNDDLSPLHGSVSSTLDQGEGGAMKPPVTPKTNVASLSPTDAQKAKPPTKPRRTVKASQSPIPPPKLKNVADGPELYSTSSKPTPGKFTKYNKTHLYNDVIPGGKTEDNQKNVVESAYEDFDNTAVRRSSSASSVDRPQTPSGRNKAPPKLPARTPESQIVLTEAPPSLPTRTPESYLTIEDICKLRRNTIAGEEDEELQTYEAVQHSSNNFDGKSHSEDRLSTSTPTGGSGSTSLAAKTKGFLEKTSNVFSKVGASIAKTNDDASHARPSTIDKRTPTYTPGPTVHSGQDMSFGKRLMKKVKGGRTFPNK